MATLTIKVRDELAKEFREFALWKTGSMRGLSVVAEDALNEYLDNHSETRRKVSGNPLMAPEALAA